MFLALALPSQPKAAKLCIAGGAINVPIFKMADRRTLLELATDLRRHSSVEWAVSRLACATLPMRRFDLTRCNSLWACC